MIQPAVRYKHDFLLLDHDMSVTTLVYFKESGEGLLLRIFQVYELHIEREVTLFSVIYYIYLWHNIDQREKLEILQS